MPGRNRAVVSRAAVTVRSLLMDEGRVTETIRARLKRRKRRAFVVAVIGFAVAAAALGCALSEIGGNRLRPVMLAAALAGAVIAFGGLLYLNFVRCPNCLGRAGPVLYSRGTNYCPQCGVSLDIPTRQSYQTASSSKT